MSYLKILKNETTRHHKIPGFHDKTYNKYTEVHMKTKIVIAEAVVCTVLFATIASLFIVAVKNIGDQLSEKTVA